MGISLGAGLLGAAAIGTIGGVLGGKSKTSTTTQLTPAQEELTQKQVELAEFQKEELERQRAAQDVIFQGAERAAGEFEAAIGEGPTAVQDELLQNQLDRIRAGGAATDEEIELINAATEQAIAAGETDINRFLKSGLETLREELAPQLGLRPGDTPILDRGSRVAAEASRQQGQLVSGLRSQQFASRLGFPLQRAATLGGLTSDALSREDAVSAFQKQLKQSAFINRLQLAGGQATAGLGLAGVSAPNIGPAFAGLNTTTKGSDPGLGLQRGLGGAGALLEGLGAFND